MIIKDGFVFFLAVAEADFHYFYRVRKVGGEVTSEAADVDGGHFRNENFAAADKMNGF